MSLKQKPTATYFEVLSRASSFLEEQGQSGFAAEWLMRERLDWSKTDLVRHHRTPMPKEQRQQFEQDFKAFVSGKPMQYIIGHDWFYHRKFKVTPATLIPRPETEEWLARVLNLLPEKTLKILDIGTGTGVLAITTKLERPQDLVTATDISRSALAVAKENAQSLKAEVMFKQGDLFEPVALEAFDVILSNPPYIGNDEVEKMDSSVLHYEPELALFAAEDGLAIYRQMAETISPHIKRGGCIFLEIGYRQARQVSKLFQKTFPKATIEIWQDFNGLDRVIAISSL